MIAGLLLAAGESRRMGSPKAFLKINNRFFFQCILCGFISAKLSPIVIVTNPMHTHLWKEYDDELRNIKLSANHNWHEGQFSSLKIGIKSIIDETKRKFGSMPEAIIMSLIDHPNVPTEVYNALIEANMQSTDHIIIPVFQNRQGHPILIPQKFFDAILSYHGDCGLKGFMKSSNPEIFRLDVNYPQILDDIDTKDEFNQLIR